MAPHLRPRLSHEVPCHQFSRACLLPFDPTGPGSHVEAAVVGIIVSISHPRDGAHEAPEADRQQVRRGLGESSSSFPILRSFFASLSTIWIPQGRTQQEKIGKGDPTLQKRTGRKDQS